MKHEYLSYKYHPRIMELRFAYIYRLARQNYGEEQSHEIMKKMIEMLNCNWTLLSQVLSKESRILSARTISKLRRKQATIFMGELYDESRYTVAKRYLNVGEAYLYQKPRLHNPSQFVTDEWLEELDDEIVIASVSAYRLELKKFLLSFDQFIFTFK